MSSYTVLVYEDKEVGGYWAKVAELPGCFTQGDSIEDVRQTVVDAIECYLEGGTEDVHALAATLVVQID